MPTESRRRDASPPVFQYVCLAILFTGAMLFQVRYAQDIWGAEKVDVPFVMPASASATLEIVRPEAEKLGLHPGDTLLAVNGQNYAGTAILAEAYARARPGGRLELRVNSASGEHSVVLPITAGTAPLSQVIFDLLLNIVAPIGCVLLGSWVVLVRPRDRLAWILLGLMFCFSQLFSAFKIEGWGPGYRDLAMAYRVTLAAGWAGFMFLFGFFFPEPFPFYTRMPAWRKWIPVLVLAPLLCQVLYWVVLAVTQMTDYARARDMEQTFRGLRAPLQTYLYCVVGVGFFASIFLKSSMAISRDAKRRLLLLYWGATIALAPLLLLTLFSQYRGKSMYELLPDWLIAIVLIMTMIFPLTLAYVIVVQRAIDVRVAARQGLQYGLAKNGILVLRLVAALVVLFTAWRLFTESQERPTKIIVAALGVLAIFTIRRVADRLRVWTDRRFFREAYNAEQVLSELSDQVRSMVEILPLIKTVAARISETLHVPRVAVLLSGDGWFRPAYALGYSSVPDVGFPANNGALKVLQQQREPARVYLDDPKSWLYREPAVSEEDRLRLSKLQSELLLPLSTRDKLLGFISLGSKLSDEPYSGTDVRLLKSVAAQAGLALENARLVSAIADEVAHRERLNRELEIAREVQERLFPQTLPPIEGIKYSGACRPALGVGGDYYDFLALPEGRLGIAIGDVSGKGIAAALMMASLQASLRGEATRAAGNLAALVGHVNHLLYEASANNRYATFFYAQYDPGTCRLTYVNAGHNPPMLFHRHEQQWQIQRLEGGGTVVGLLETFPYEQSDVIIAPGDILLMFTDGISEALNAADEEWGEARLIETVKQCGGLEPAQIIAGVMQAADGFVAGEKQHDDMTLVVLCARP
ncbi:MAG: SpoIIE family protein phosphatase [Terriglobales bacterium]|jgi:sigma-B regulation protein RsbU (phosphoserine phosphatase)